MSEFIIGAKSGHRVEIVRSFTFKLNRGNYESSDFFCSQKGECDSSDAEAYSDALYQFCKREVMKAVKQFQEEHSTRRAS